MRRRMQGFIRQSKQEDNNNCKVEQDKVSEIGRYNTCIPEDQPITDSVTGLVNTNAPVQTDLVVNRQDTEASEELISKVLEQYQQQLFQQQQLLQQQQLFQQQQQQQKQQQQQQQAQATQQQNPGQQQEQSERNMLQALIAKLLLSEDKNSVSPQTYDQGAKNPILAANDRSLQQNSQQGNQQQANQQISNELPDQQIIQTDLTGKLAAQVLSEAQYELSNELEVSLKKLRAVIDESKQIAQKISTILAQNGKGNGSNKSDN